MVMTILDAHVEPGKAADVERAFTTMANDSNNRGTAPEQSYLIHSTTDPTLWRIISVWSSREALDRMRATEPVPVAVMIFRSVGAQPVFSLFDVAGSFGGEGHAKVMRGVATAE